MSDKSCGCCVEVEVDLRGCGAKNKNEGAGQFGEGLAGIIDHTLLKCDATKRDLVKLCEEAVQYGFAAVCVNSSNVFFVANLLKESKVKVAAVVGFPLGACTTQTKRIEAQGAVDDGAEEIDMVINIGALKAKDYLTVHQDISTVVQAVLPCKVKVIIETCCLSHEEKIVACALAKAAGAAFVKTSTGFGKSGATVEDVELMRSIVGTDMQIKASGGVRTREDLEAMVKAGADRIGTSSGVSIVTGVEKCGQNY
jgi:deoxyribose-phosphate aldolase